MKQLINDYTTQGYRCYLLSDFNFQNLVTNLPNLQRKNKLEIMIIHNVVFVKGTDRYDKKNPYVKGN